MHVLEIENFAQIDHARIEFGDLTVLVGPQGSGKSLVLQWLKLALDVNEVQLALQEAGHDVSTEANMIDLCFGQGMSEAWSADRTRVWLDDKLVRAMGNAKRNGSKPTRRVHYIPAHRAMLLADGWPSPFQKFNSDTPVVARLFSQTLYKVFGDLIGTADGLILGIQGHLAPLIDSAIFHGGKVVLDKDLLRYRLQLSYGNVKLPFMAWTAGQRECMPLLTGLIHVMPIGVKAKVNGIDWIVIEEPEMGLHPQAIAATMALVLDLLYRGYKVVVSTHSPLILDIVWAIKRIQESNGRWQILADTFGLDHRTWSRNAMKNALAATYRVFLMDLDEHTGRSSARDISELDPDSENENEATWGGLTGFSSKFGQAVRQAVNEVRV